MVKSMRRINFRPRNRQELINGITECWQNLTVEYCEALIRFMPRRINLVIENNGNAIKY
jgi:hypothetical protein